MAGGDDNVGSLQPNQPGVLQIDEEDVVVAEVGCGTPEVGVAVRDWLEQLVVVSSLQPNQPGVSQVVVAVGCLSLFAVVLVVVVVVVVVVSSRQPHHPGVLQVVVRVVVVLVEVVLVVEGFDSWLSKYSQLKQSVQLITAWHLAGASYFSRTSLRTSLIRWFPMPLRQPKSPTVSYAHVMPVWQALCMA